MLKRVLIILLLAVNLSSGLSVNAQDIMVGRLTYLRTYGSTWEFVNLTPGGSERYILPEGGCGIASPNGVYLLEASWRENYLIVRDLATFEIVIQTDWSDDWDRCAFVWFNDSQFAIRQQGTLQDYFDFEISNGSLTPFTFEPTLPQYPELPRWLSTTENNFILPSPRPNIFLYERCESGNVSPRGNVCDGGVEFVIYDIAEQTDVHVLVNPSPDIAGRNEDINSIPHDSVAWSQDGRYLAFEHIARINFPFTLSVYDLDTNQYLDTHFVSAELDSFKNVRWSPTEHTLAFWTIGSLTTEEFDFRTARHLVFFDADTSEFIVTDTAYDFEFSGYVSAAWSPDVSAFVFVAQNSNLILADTSTGSTTVLDDHVNRVIAWNRE